MEVVRIKLGFAKAFVVDSVGRSGGLALIWKDEGEVEIQNYSRRHKCSGQGRGDTAMKVYRFLRSSRMGKEA